MADDRRRALDQVPDLADAPLDWDVSGRRFRNTGSVPPPERPAPQRRSGTAGLDARHHVVAAPPPGGKATPPPRRTPEVILPGATRAPDATAVAPPPAPAGGTPRMVVPAPGAPPKQPPAAARTHGDQPPPDGPGTRTARRGWWPPSWRTVRRTLGAVVLLLVLLTVGGLLWGYQQFQSIEKVELGDVLASADGTNYLIVGSDTREGISPDDPNASAILGPDAPAGSERSDTILILRVDDDGSRMLSVPRDLLVTIAETGSVSRINAAFNGGPRRLIATLSDQLQLPIHHYVEIDFVAFRDLVDALGGITIDFPHPASDHMSGLHVPEAGPQRLDGTQALAYVRSRYYTETIDGRQVTEPTGDLGRVARQQQFLAAVVHEVGSVRNPVRAMGMVSSMVDGMRVDDQMSYLDSVRLALRLRSMDLEPTALPTSNRRLSSGAQVLDLVQPGADEVLARFGSAGAAIG